MAKGDDAFRLIVGSDGVKRPAWAANDSMMQEYFDDEWGQSVRDDHGVFERISLEVFQSGLSWRTILGRREGFRAVFENFEPEVIASWSDADIDRVLGDERIIRNRRKVEAMRTNARATCDLANGSGLSGIVWSYAQERQETVSLEDATHLEIPAQVPESVALAKELKAKGFTMVGPVNVCATMLAIGVVPPLNYLR